MFEKRSAISHKYTKGLQCEPQLKSVVLDRCCQSIEAAYCGYRVPPAAGMSRTDVSHKRQKRKGKKRFLCDRTPPVQYLQKTPEIRPRPPVNLQGVQGVYRVYRGCKLFLCSSGPLVGADTAGVERVISPAWVEDYADERAKKRFRVNDWVRAAPRDVD